MYQWKKTWTTLLIIHEEMIRDLSFDISLKKDFIHIHVFNNNHSIILFSLFRILLYF